MRAETFPPGAPCWVESLQPDPRAGLAFYRGLFGWDGAGPGPMPGGGEYFVARLDGDEVAGIAALPPGGIAEPAWSTYVAVDRLDVAVDRVLAAGGRSVVPALTVPPAGSLAIIEAPTGASLGLWEPAARAGAQRTNEPGAWTMSTLRTPDLARATPFYAAVFGWSVEPREIGGAQGAAFRLPGHAGGRPHQPGPLAVVALAVEVERLDEHWSVDFEFHDVERAARRVVEGGGTVIRPPFAAGIFRRAVLACPAGAIFTVTQLKSARLLTTPAMNVER